MASKTKDKYKKGDKVNYGASPMLAKSKAEKSKEKVGYVSKVKKDIITGKSQYLINNITIPHSNVVGLSEALALMKNPAKTWSFVGSVPGSLAYTEKDGSPLTAKTQERLQSASNPAMIAKTRSFKSKDDALKAAKKLKISTNKIQIVGENKTQGENTMKITKTQLVELIKEVLQEETEYQKYFKEKLAGRNLGDMSDEEKKAFFADIDKGWKGEKNETLKSVSPAAGNPLKRVKAKKRDQILAQEKVENYVRKLVREELKFVMFNEVPAGLSRKVTKKRISQTGSTDKSL